MHNTAQHVILSSPAQHLCSVCAATETTASEGPEAKQAQQAQQHRRPQEPKGQMQHNQAAVKHKLLDRLADEVLALQDSLLFAR